MASQPHRHLVVVYHENCIDGLASAWALHQKWGYEQHTTIAYIPYGHHKSAEAEQTILSALTPDTELYFLDVAPEKRFLDELLSPGDDAAEKLAAVRIHDHHKTAAVELAQYTPPVIPSFTTPALDIQIDESRLSASHMIWETFLPDQDAPPFLDMLDKMDRGEGLLTEEDFAAAAFIDSQGIISLTDAFNACSKLSKLDYQQMAEHGRKIHDDQKIRIEKLNENVMYTQTELLPGAGTVRVPIINADVQSFGRSINNYLRDLGDKSGAGAAFAWHMDGNGCVTMCIRTTGKPDASKIAENFCQAEDVFGGGHNTSAAVHFPSLEKFCEQVVMEPKTVTKKAKHKPVPPHNHKH